MIPHDDWPAEQPLLHFVDPNMSGANATKFGNQGFAVDTMVALCRDDEFIGNHRDGNKTVVRMEVKEPPNAVLDARPIRVGIVVHEEQATIQEDTVEQGQIMVDDLGRMPAIDAEETDT